MDLNQMTLDELNAKKAELEAQDSLDVNEHNRVSNRISELELEQQQAEAQQQRQQAQAQEIAATKARRIFSVGGTDISLPDDIAELFELVLDDILPPIYQKHNDEVAKLSADYQETKRAADDRETQLQRQNDELQTKLDTLNKLVNTLNFEKTDAETKRDNAVKDLEAAKAEIEQHKSHLDELRVQLANAPAPKAAIDITPTEEKTKRAIELSETINKKYVGKPKQIAANWYEVNAEDGSKDLIHKIDLPVLQFRKDDEKNTNAQSQGDQLPSSQEAPNVTEQQFHTQDEVPAETVPAPAPAGDVVSETVSRSEFEALQQRVSAIEEHFKPTVKSADEAVA